MPQTREEQLLDAIKGLEHKINLIETYGSEQAAADLNNMIASLLGGGPPPEIEQPQSLRLLKIMLCEFKIEYHQVMLGQIRARLLLLQTNQ